MFRNVLVPVDFTAESAAAVDVAADLAAADGSISLMHVVQTVPGLDPGGDAEFYRRLEETAAEKIEQLGRRLAARGRRWDALLVVGNRLDEVVKAAGDEIDLLVVSSHRIDFDAPEKGTGNLSYRIAFAVPCPVLLLK